MTVHRSIVFAMALALGFTHAVTQAQETVDANDETASTPVRTVTFDSGDISTIDSFRNNSAELTPDGLNTMRALFLKISVLTGIKAITVAGHTSTRGAAPYNIALSERRAATIARLLATRYPDAHMTVIGMGETQPVTDDATPEAEARNRRVEIHVSTTASAPE